MDELKKIINQLIFKDVFFFNANGHEVFPLPENTNSNNTKNTSESNSDTTLFVNNTQLEIAQFHNANIIDGEAAYLGFEFYEIDNAYKWKYKRQNLIKKTIGH